jgi:hypothetical protein
MRIALRTARPPHPGRVRAGAMVTALALLWLGGPARADWLAPLVTETAETIHAGSAEIGLGASYFRNQRFPAFTPSGYVQSQNLIAGPQLGFRIAAGSMVEIQASYELLDLDEHTVDGHHSTYGGGDARLFTKVYMLAERTWIPAAGLRFGTKLPNANQSDRLGTDETDFFIQALASKQIGDFAVHANLGIALLGNPTGSGGQDDLFTYAVALVSPTLGAHTDDQWGVRALLEATGTAGSRFDNDGAEMRGGLQVLYGGWRLYAGASGGLASAAAKYGFMGGAIYAFELERLAALFR